MTSDGGRLEPPGGREETVRIRENGTGLDVVAAAGVALQFDRPTGACATCTAQLLAGAVEHWRPPRALKDRHLGDGYVPLYIASRGPTAGSASARTSRGTRGEPWE